MSGSTAAGSRCLGSTRNSACTSTAIEAGARVQSAQIVLLHLAHSGIALQRKHVRDRGDLAFHARDSALCNDAGKRAPHRSDRGADRMIAADNEADLAERRDLRERELR